MNFDAEDTALLGLVAVAASVMAGVGTFELFGYSLSDTYAMLGGDFTLAYIATVGAFGFTVWTNEMDLDPSTLRENARDELDDTYYYTLLAGVAVLALWPFIPEISNWVTSSDITAVVFIAGSVGTQLAIGYLR